MNEQIHQSTNKANNGIKSDKRAAAAPGEHGDLRAVLDGDQLIVGRGRAGLVILADVEAHLVGVAELAHGDLGRHGRPHGQSLFCGGEVGSKVTANKVCVMSLILCSALVV